ncbi:MAG: hypothetical protein ACK4KT_03090 [Thermaurantimonas sp.]
MKKIAALSLLFLGLIGMMNNEIRSQDIVRNIPFDILKNQLYGGANLPAEEPFRVSGDLPQEVNRVELIVYEKSENKAPIFTRVFVRPFNMTAERFELQVDPLHDNRQYVFRFLYFVDASPDQLRALQLSLNANLEAVIRSNYIFRRNSIVGLQSPKSLQKTLEDVVHQGLGDFRHASGRQFSGFSSILTAKMRQIERESLSNARFNIKSKSKIESQRVGYAEKLISELIQLAQSEATQFLSDNMLVVVEERTIITRTEKLPGVLPINIGYGLVYWEGDFSNLVYNTAPYVGVSFPLANRTFARYLGNASLSLGVMLRDLEFSDTKYSGPIVNLPIYAALGYKIFRVARFNLGATLLSSDPDSNGSTQLNAALFTGISIELNVWAGFDKKRRR